VHLTALHILAPLYIDFLPHFIDIVQPDAPRSVAGLLLLLAQRSETCCQMMLGIPDAHLNVSNAALKIFLFSSY